HGGGEVRRLRSFSLAQPSGRSPSDGSVALEVLIRAGPEIHRSVPCAEWGLSIRWQQARGWARYGPTSRAKAPWPPSRGASNRPCSAVIASAPKGPPPRRRGGTRHFATPTAPPAVRAAPPRRAGGRGWSHRRSARPRRTAATADAASGTRSSPRPQPHPRSEEHTSELQSLPKLPCPPLLA